MTSPLARSTPRAICAARPLSGETSTRSAPARCAAETVASSLPPSTTTTSQPSAPAPTRALATARATLRSSFSAGTTTDSRMVSVPAGLQR